MELLLQLGQSKPDNNDVILQDLVSNRNFKQALNNAEKRLRKNKTNKLLVRPTTPARDLPDDCCRSTGRSFSWRRRTRRNSSRAKQGSRSWSRTATS